MTRSTAWLAALICLGVIVSAIGCSGDDASMAYTADEVLDAFDAAAYPLIQVEVPPSAGIPEAAAGTYLVPKDSANLSVFVATDQEAGDAWADYVRLGGDEDSLTIRRANVLAISDGDLSSRAKERVRAAMKALPDRGHAVEVLEDSASTALLARCGSRGAPVTLAELVRVLRANGVTLDIHERGCERPTSDPHHPDATNAGPSGLKLPPSAYAREGHVLCDVAHVPNADNREVEIVKYPTDSETQVGILNVGCAVYPSGAESEKGQVDRLRKALEAVERAEKDE